MQALLAPRIPGQVRERDGYSRPSSGIDVRGSAEGRDPLNQSLYLVVENSPPRLHPDDVGDRMEMAHSIEGRVPFLDHHLVEVVRSQPVSQKIRGMTEKYRPAGSSA